MPTVTNLPLFILNNVFDRDDICGRLQKQAIAAVHRNTKNPKQVQYLLDNKTIPKLFQVMRYNLKSVRVQILVVETLAKVFRTATNAQIGFILAQLDDDILSDFHRVLVLENNKKSLFQPVCLMLVNVMSAITSNEFAEIPNSKNLLFDSDMVTTLRFIILYSYENWDRPEFPKKMVSNMMQIALPAAKIGLTGSKRSVLGSVDIIFEMMPLMHFAGQVKVLDRCVSFLYPLKPVLEMFIADTATEDDYTIVATIIRTMMNYTVFEEAGVELLVQADLIPLIIKLLDFKQLETDTSVLVYDIMTNGSTEHIQACIDAGILEKIPALLGIDAYELTKKVMIDTLVTILLDGDPSQYEMVTHPDYVDCYLPVVLERAQRRYDFLNPVSKKLLNILPASLWRDRMPKGTETS